MQMLFAWLQEDGLCRIFWNEGVRAIVGKGVCVCIHRAAQRPNHAATAPKGMASELFNVNNGALRAYTLDSKPEISPKPFIFWLSGVP